MIKVSGRMSALLVTGGLALILAPCSFATNFTPGSSLSINETGAVAVNLQYVDFGYTGTPNAPTVGQPTTASECPGIACTTAVNGSGVGVFSISGFSSSGTFFGLTGNADVEDLCRTGPGPCANPVAVGVNTSIPNFVTFTTQPTWSVTLTQVQAGDFTSTACSETPGTGVAGETCTPLVPGGSQFDLTNNGTPGQKPTGVTISFTFLGTIQDSATPGSQKPIQGTFSTNFSGTDLQTIIADIAAGDAIVSGANATLVVNAANPVPEPATASFLVIGGGLLALARFRSMRKKS